MFAGRNPNYVARSKKSGDQSCMMTVTNVRVQSVVEPLYMETTDCVHGDCPAVHYGNDIALVLNQKRLDRMTLQGFSDYLNQSQVNDDPLRQIRSQMTDEQLMKFVKSRYIQSPSELKSWYSYLHNTMCNEINNYNQTVIDQANSLNAKAAASPAPAPANNG